jgi:hypothetical protein
MDQKSIKQIRNQIMAALGTAIAVVIFSTIAIVKVQGEKIQQLESRCNNNTADIKQLQDKTLCKDEFVRYMEIIREDIAHIRELIGE